MILRYKTCDTNIHIKSINYLNIYFVDDRIHIHFTFLMFHFLNDWLIVDEPAHRIKHLVLRFELVCCILIKWLLLFDLQFLKRDVSFQYFTQCWTVIIWWWLHHRYFFAFSRGPGQCVSQTRRKVDILYFIYYASLKKDNKFHY